jgi:hypothetical protein
VAIASSSSTTSSRTPRVAAASSLRAAERSCGNVLVEQNATERRPTPRNRAASRYCTWQRPSGVDSVAHVLPW